MVRLTVILLGGEMYYLILKLFGEIIYIELIYLIEVKKKYMDTNLYLIFFLIAILFNFFNRTRITR
jgi:hypothetical protein